MKQDDRVHAEVRTLLPAYVDRSLGQVRRQLVAVHLRRCAACQEEFSRQRSVAEGLASLAAPVEGPPDGLLEQLLENAGSPKGAAPLRGAVSGARPAYSAALLLAGAVTAAGAGYASWASARSLRRRLRNR